MAHSGPAVGLEWAVLRWCKEYRARVTATTDSEWKEAELTTAGMNRPRKLRTHVRPDVENRPGRPPLILPWATATMTAKSSEAPLQPPESIVVGWKDAIRSP